MGSCLLAFQEIDRTQIAAVGGKGANLGELSRIEGVQVPAGFCVATDAFRRIVADAPSCGEQIERLASLTVDDLHAIRAMSAELRRTIVGLTIPDDLSDEVASALDSLGADGAYAVRSSATAEDLPTASFAGQHDTFLNVVGLPSILAHLSLCWASLFTERAVVYRLRNGIDHGAVGMAVVVQRMIFPQAAGVLFTADPVTGNRKVVTVEASFGLGEALVSGLVPADAYAVRDSKIVSRRIAAKHLMSVAAPGGGTEERAIELERQSEPVLTDDRVVRLAHLGRQIEAHFGRPQDIEWCSIDDDLHIVQSRPIATLYPIPASDDGENHVYVSVGHQQMMTDPMKPLGISLWQLTAGAPMHEAGGRLFIDVTRALASPTSRAGLLDALGTSDPTIGDALQTVLDRGDFLKSDPDVGSVGPPAGATPAQSEPDPAIVAACIERTEVSLAALKRDIQEVSGSALFDFILADLQELKGLLFDPHSHQAIMAGIDAARWLNERLQTWLGEKNAADTLAQSVPNNVTSEMGLALLDVADAIRPHPDVVAFLERVDDDGFLDQLPAVPGGQGARDAVVAFLDRFGMRCAGEIDITRPRWSERPTVLLSTILGNVKNFEPGEGARRFERGRQEAARKERELLDRLRGLPDGDRRAEEAGQAIARLRTFAGYREYPKYGMICRYAIYKRAILAEAERLVESHVLRELDDVFYLTFHELHDLVRTQRADARLIHRRKEAFVSYGALTPPRVLTSDGEAIVGRYRRDGLPDGALVGLAVSAGTIEGRARVVLDMATAELDTGDILVTAFTDPSWTPLFVSIAGLVTEVGGLMTHGAVIAREYGVPAVVGVEQATRLIRDGQRIRVHGTDGYVEILS